VRAGWLRTSAIPVSALVKVAQCVCVRSYYIIILCERVIL